MELRLLVIRTSNPEQLAGFYSLLGCKFDYHKHGNSPFHYGTTIGNTVLELYPLAKNQSIADIQLRLGFAIDNFQETINSLKEQKVIFLSEPTDTDFGHMCIIADPEGRKVELYRP